MTPFSPYQIRLDAQRRRVKRLRSPKDGGRSGKLIEPELAWPVAADAVVEETYIIDHYYHTARRGPDRSTGRRAHLGRAEVPTALPEKILLLGLPPRAMEKGIDAQLMPSGYGPDEPPTSTQNGAAEMTQY